VRRYVSQFSFGVVLALLSVATVVGVGLAVVMHRLYLIPIVVGVAFAGGLVYIGLFARPRLGEEPVEPPIVSPEPPAPETAPAGPVDPVDQEPFYDPVEEADRLDSERPP
jgi:hypothetical protein